jgi:thiamine biosynthesis lipoprotein
MRDARDSVKLVDSLMSIFTESSELTALNRSAGGLPVHVSPQLMDVLLLARRYWRLSGGNFDPTVGPLARAWGFYGDSGRIPPAGELDSLRALVDFGEVEIDSIEGTVRIAHVGMEMDLGGVAKGYALDLARKALDVPDARGIMVDLGGNVLVAGLPPHGSKWRIGVRDPRAGDDLLGALLLDSGAVATSGDYERFYLIDGRRYSHIIDPHTGAPARGTIAATVVGPTGSWSDGLSATLYLAGAERALSLADSLPGVGALIVRADASGEKVGDLGLSRRMRGLWESESGVRNAERPAPLRAAVPAPNP